MKTNSALQAAIAEDAKYAAPVVPVPGFDPDPDTPEFHQLEREREAIERRHGIERRRLCERCGSRKPIGQSCDCFDNGCQ